jgi:hypothetical protein
MNSATALFVLVGRLFLRPARIDPKLGATGIVRSLYGFGNRSISNPMVALSINLCSSNCL